jgi:hypothetical protein
MRSKYQDPSLLVSRSERRVWSVTGTLGKLLLAALGVSGIVGTSLALSAALWAAFGPGSRPADARRTARCCVYDCVEVNFGRPSRRSYRRRVCRSDGSNCAPAFTVGDPRNRPYYRCTLRRGFGVRTCNQCR